MRIFFAAYLLLACCAARADQDDDFLAAREAFRTGDAARLDLCAGRLQGHALEPYAAYWRLRLRLEDADGREVESFVEQYRDSLVAERLRIEWLKMLGRKQRWQELAAEASPPLADDPELACYVRQGRLHSGDTEVLRQTRPLWFSGRDLPEACTPLFQAMFAAQILGTEDAWNRLRLALEAGNVSVARSVAAYLPKSQAPDARLMQKIADHPQRHLPKLGLKTRAGRELAMFALARMASHLSPQLAEREFQKIREHFSDAERAQVRGQLAYHAARRHDPDALAWFREAGDAPLSAEQLGWKARAALRVQDWEGVLAAIAAMPQQNAQAANWRYWKARALKAQGQAAEANAILAPLSLDHHFYGQLAADELGTVLDNPPQAYKPDQDEVRAAEQLPAVRRALAFYRLGLRLEGANEWQWALRGMNDRQLLAAAEVARRNEWYDRAIYTADKTVQLHDFSLRYPTPYRSRMEDTVRRLQLDEAWVYGVVRQESRFIADAKSGAGASGLMQIMPKTARWVAKRLGFKDYRKALARDLDANITLGAYYLRHVLDVSDNQPVLASAAYNAGPRRARQWRADAALEGAVYAETIPFSETRDYVKKVMSNAAYYAGLLGQQWSSLKQRLGIVTGRAQGEEQPLAGEP